MVKKSLIVVAVILLAMASSTCYAAWTDSLMRAIDPSDPPNLLADTLLLSPSYSVAGGVYTYTYVLTNNTVSEHIVGFTLVFPTQTSVSQFTAIQAPAGWTAYPRWDTQNKINWRWTNGLDADSLLPGQSKTFAFSTLFAPSETKNVFASSQDSFGFSGITYGPVPEPGSLVALMSGLIGLVGLKMRKRI